MVVINVSELGNGDYSSLETALKIAEPGTEIHISHGGIGKTHIRVVPTNADALFQSKVRFGFFQRLLVGRCA
jgi:hypothetical protein